MNRPATARSHDPELLMSLEPRRMLAATFGFTDGDGDEVTVKLTGDGNAVGDFTGGLLNFLTLTGTTAGSALSISVKRIGGGDGRVRLGGMSGGIDLAKINAPTTDLISGAEVNVNSLTSLVLGDVGDDATVNVDAPPGKSISVSFRNIDEADVLLGGLVKSFKAVSVDDEANVEASNTVAAIAIQTDMGGEWDAANFGKITVGQQFRARMNASLPDANGYSFGAIKAGSAIEAGLSHPFQTDAGRIKSITITGSWTLGGILAAGIDTLKVGGDFLPQSVNLSEVADVPFSIKTGTVVGTMNGLFIFAGPVGSLKIGSTGGSLVFDAVGNRVDVKSLTFTGPADVFGEFQFNTIGTLSAAKSRLGGEWSLGGANAKGLSIGAIKAFRIDEFETGSLMPGGIGSIATGEMDDSEIIAQFFTKITVKAKSGADGSIDDTEIVATGVDAAGFSIKSLSAGGGIDETWIATAGNVDRFTTFSFSDSDLFVGLTNPLQDDHPDFANFDDFQGSGLLNRFTVTRAFDILTTAMDSSHVVAGTIANIKINGFIENDEGGETYGFGAVAFGSVTIKNQAGTSFKPVITANADTNPFAPTFSDFIFRDYAG